MMARKTISKKTRFEIFKRDRFTCAYCGDTPPKAILHVDHITPVASGGDNSLENLITSCSACNLGKGARSLDSVPNAQKQTIKQMTAEMAEREEQAMAYYAMVNKRRERLDDEMWEVVSALECQDMESYSRVRLRSIRSFLEKMPFHLVFEMAEQAATRIHSSGDRRFRYFCGCCWNRLREAGGE